MSTYLEAVKDITGMLNDPDAETYKTRAQVHLIRGMNTVIKSGDYVPEDIPSLYVMRRDLYFGEYLSETLLDTHAKWDVTNDFTDSNKALVYAYGSDVTSLATQASASLVRVGLANQLYKFSYRCKVVTALSGITATITTGFAHSAVTLPVTDGWHSVTFLSANGAATGDFVLSFVASTGAGEVVLDNLSLAPTQAENIMKVEKLFFDPNNTSAPTVTITEKTLDEVALIGNNAELQPGVEDLYIYRKGNNFYPIVASNSNFTIASDYVSMSYITNIDNSNWVDGTELSMAYTSGVSAGTYLFSEPFVERAIAIAVQTMLAEVAGE